jgi:hypothetical protein
MPTRRRWIEATPLSDLAPVHSTLPRSAMQVRFIIANFALGAGWEVVKWSVVVLVGLTALWNMNLWAHRATTDSQK